MPIGCGNTMSEFEKLLKENILNPKAQALGDSWIEDAKLEGNHGYHAHDRVFGEGNDHLVIPVTKSSTLRKVDPDYIHSSIKEALIKHGYAIHDYAGNVAVRQRTTPTGEIKEDKSSISKILAREKDGKALRIFNNDPKRAAVNSDQHEIVISRSPQDLMRMTSSRKWAGGHCTRMPGPEMVHPELTKHISPEDMENGGLFHHMIRHDIRHGTLIAYLVNKGDHTVQNPIARILLKRHHADTSPLSGSDRDVWVPEGGHDFGHPTDSFKETVNKWSHDNYPRLRPGERHVRFSKNSDLYNDDKHSFTAYKPGTYTDEYSTTHRNELGQLHDPKEGTPASTVEKGDRSIETHYKNGKIHRDGDKPAEKVFDYNRGENTSLIWAKHGFQHRDGDKPAVIDSMGRGTVYQYKKFGMLHRETSLGPAEHGPARTLYAMNDTEHRPVTEGPSSISKDGDYQYREYGDFKRPPTGGPAARMFGHTHIWPETHDEPRVTLKDSKITSRHLKIEHNDGTEEQIFPDRNHYTKFTKEKITESPMTEEHHATFNKYLELSKIAPKFEEHKGS